MRGDFPAMRPSCSLWGPRPSPASHTSCHRVYTKQEPLASLSKHRGNGGQSARRLASRRMTSCPPTRGWQAPRAGEGVPKARGAGLWVGGGWPRHVGTSRPRWSTRGCHGDTQHTRVLLEPSSSQGRRSSFTLKSWCVPTLVPNVKTSEEPTGLRLGSPDRPAAPTIRALGVSGQPRPLPSTGLPKRQSLERQGLGEAVMGD